MKTLNRNTIKANRYPERIIQFGEGNFLRAFVDWIIYNMNQKAKFNSSVVVVQPLEKGMINVLNEQDGLYHVNLQGLQNGKAVDNIQLIDVISRGINPYTQYNEYIKLAENPETRFIISNTTEAGITFDPQCKLEDIPAKSYPGKLTQLLYHRFKTFNGVQIRASLFFLVNSFLTMVMNLKNVSNNISSIGISNTNSKNGSIQHVAYIVL